MVLGLFHAAWLRIAPASADFHLRDGYRSTKCNEEAMNVCAGARDTSCRTSELEGGQTDGCCNSSSLAYAVSSATPCESQGCKPALVILQTKYTRGPLGSARLPPAKKQCHPG